MNRRGFIAAGVAAASPFAARASMIPISALKDIPPIGEWRKLTNSPLIADGRPSTRQASGFLAENIVFDPATNKYWMVFSNFTDQSIGIAWSPDMLSWTIDQLELIPSLPETSQAPHLLFDAGTWYLYYAKPYSTGSAIYVATCSTPNGSYANETLLLTPIPGTWEADRVMEQYVFLDDDGIWKMFYMGDQFDAVGASQEQIGYATGPSPAGPFTRYASNPVIRFGLPGSYDGGVIADPHIVKFAGTYYIFYSCGFQVPRPWTTALAISTDLVSFWKQGVVLSYGDEGTWDNGEAVRGAITRVGDVWYFPYTGHNGQSHSIGMAVLPAKGLLS